MVTLVVVGVRVHVHAGIPEGTAVGDVVQDTAREDVSVYAGCGIHGVRASRGKSDRLLIVRQIRCNMELDLPSCQSSLRRPRCMLHRMHAR